MRTSWLLGWTLAVGCTAELPSDATLGDGGSDGHESAVATDGRTPRPDRDPLVGDGSPPLPDLAPPDAGRPVAGSLLHVPPRERFDLAEGVYLHGRVLVEGVLHISGTVTLEAGLIEVRRGGRIDGVGTGQAGHCDGADGQSTHGRGAGGGGASGACWGGAGGGLNDGTASTPAGPLLDDLAQAGCQGGRGGDREALGGTGGMGGASLRLAAAECRLEGGIALSGAGGETPVQSDGGGGGGGAGGNLRLDCGHAFFGGRFKAHIGGGAGGQGGVVDGWTGGGGGGGASGRLSVQVDTAVVDGTPVPQMDLVEALAAQVSAPGGAPGEPGRGGDDDEAGEPGDSCWRP